jgi:CTP:molybdopterin cytidylyltransferase MocA
LNSKCQKAFYLTDTKRLPAIILAAGVSTRMGEFKPLMPLGKTTIIERIVRLFRSAGISDVRVVTGHRSSALSPVLKLLRARQIYNPAYAEGMFSSVLAGVNSLESDKVAFFLLPVDIPLVRKHTLETLISAFAVGSRSILYPVFEGQRGHPQLISTDLLRGISRWSGQGGLCACLEQYEQRAANVIVADENILSDMDTPADYERLVARHKWYDIPSVRECRVMMTQIFAVEEAVIDHCLTVARVASKLGMALKSSHCELSLDLLIAATLLHDLARNTPDHAAAAAEALRGMGYPSVAKIVGAHMNIAFQSQDPIREAEVLYLADKLVEGDHIVEMEARFKSRIRQYAHNPKTATAIKHRLTNAVKIKRCVESLTRRSVESIITQNSSENPDDLYSQTWGD